MRLFTICSILAVTLFQLRTIGLSACVLLRLGITLWRDGQYLLKFAWAELLTCQYRQLALEHDRISVRARINAPLNRDPPDPLPLPAAMTPPVSLPDTQQLRRSAEVSHPEIHRSKAKGAAASSQVALAEKAFLPDFNANVGYVGTLDPADKRLQIGVSINVPPIYAVN